MQFINNIPVSATISHISISSSRFQNNEIFLSDGSKRSCSEIPVSTRTVPAQPGLELHTGGKVRPLLTWEIAQPVLGGSAVVLPMGLSGSESYFIHDAASGQCWNSVSNWSSLAVAKKDLTHD